MKPIILLADDHIMLSKGLRKSIEYDFGYKDVNSVTSCNEILKELKKKIYTHLVLDIGLSDGSSLEILPTINNLYPDLNIMIFSAKPAATYERALRKYGIHNYLSKEADEDDTISRLGKFFQNEKLRVDNSLDNPFSKLTARELEILHYLLQGKGTFEIRDFLNLKGNTVSTLKGRIFDKTQTSNIKELLELATLHNIS